MTPLALALALMVALVQAVSPLVTPVAQPPTITRYLPVFPLADASFEALWLPVSGRKDAQPHPVLMQVAQAHADELCYRELVLHEAQGYNLHIGLDGSTPNERIARAGYPLPDGLDEPGNYFESIAVTHLGPRVALNILLHSSGHVAHVTGGNEFFAAQTHYGVGRSCNAWYVLLTAP